MKSLYDYVPVVKWQSMIAVCLDWVGSQSEETDKIIKDAEVDPKGSFGSNVLAKKSFLLSRYARYNDFKEDLQAVTVVETTITSYVIDRKTSKCSKEKK